MSHRSLLLADGVARNGLGRAARPVRLAYPARKTGAHVPATVPLGPDGFDLVAARSVGGWADGDGGGNALPQRRDPDVPQAERADAGTAARTRRYGADDMRTRPVLAASPVYHHADDRVRLHALLTALDASSVALQRDLNRGEGRKGDIGIHGKLGQIYADGTGFLLCVNAKDERDQSLRRWTNIKRRLAFCRITQDGDDEGCLRLDRLPTSAEAVLIREALGIRKRRTLTEDGRAQLAVARRAANSTFNATAIDSTTLMRPPPIPPDWSIQGSAT